MKHKLMLLLSILAVLFAGCEKLDDTREEDDFSDEIKINPNYVPIDWESSTVQSYDDNTGNYVIQFANSVPDLHPGSVIAIDRDTVAFYRIVVSSERNGNTLHLTTAEADLTDIFHDCNFTFTTESSSRTKAKGVVFHPVAAYTIDDVGNYRAINLKSKRDTRFTHNLWHYGFNNDGYIINEGPNHRIQMDRMNMDVDIDFEMYMNFGGATARQLAGEAFVRYISDAMQVNAALIGSFNTEQMIRFIVWGGCDVTTPTITLIKNIFPAKTIKFMAGPVPVVIKLQSDLCGKASVGGSGEIQAYAGFSDHAVGRVGFEWNQSTGIRGVSSFENEFSYTPPTVEGKGEIYRKVWLFPRISLMLYGIVGPGFDIMTYEADTVRGGFREQMLGKANDYCAYQFDLSTGLDLCCELNLGIFKRQQIINDVTGGVIPSTPIWNVFNKRLYHSPHKVRHASGRPQNGGQATVYFDVYDTILLTHSSVKTILPQIVKFEANGQLSSEYGIAVPGTGRVSVQWTPSGESDILYAKLYGIDGDVLAWDTVKAGEFDNNGNWVDLGLPSGLLWAKSNVGSWLEYGYGDYYFWGETIPKINYDPTDYQWGRFDSVGGPWFPVKYTGGDNLNRLQSSDDAATANYGGRMPTKEEWQELLNNTTSTWTTINGVHGCRFTGPNGNSIFLPAAGYRSFLFTTGEGLYGLYWSSSLYMDDPHYAWCMDIDEGVNWEYGWRNRGLPVRAVLQN